MDEPTIPFGVSWAARLFRTRFDARARALGLTRSQWGMIATIRLREGATQSEVASQMEINSVTAGRIVDKLENSGWIERRANPADRRANRLYLKDAATPLIDKLGALASDEQSLATRGFTAEEEALFRNLLQRMIHNLNTAPLPPAPALEENALLTSQDCA